MKHILNKFMLCLAAVLLATAMSAQDIIVTMDAKKIEAKILEVSQTEIKYKEKNYLDGPTFILETNKISSIIYGNGQVVLYNQPESPEEQPKPQKKEVLTPTVEESMAEIELVSGQIITAQITDLKSNEVSYILDNEPHAILSSQVVKVTFLHSGQVREYTVRPLKPAVEQTSAHQATAHKDSVSTPASDPQAGRIYRDNGHYLRNGTYISEKEVVRILERENKAAYNQWQKADKMLIGGAVCTGIGGGLVIGGLVALVANPLTCVIIDCTALVPLGIGLGLTLGSSAHHNHAIDIYNSKYDQAAVQLKWNVAPNGVGLAIAF